ncbi:restriction endonuclease subunit S [Neptunomonas antarctica]|uniref:Type I restriction enzyme, S subunit n=1 Tax=Neptunomonas antarctica TaxID=619304 RepID=A0A1N7M8N7_9GAMM|nr:restriction endonuclease subunit S [Neptunomonas antarctica]SIS82486.1 type I restriction enzyme, S subunit [Neptunomonas antarctica]
MTRNIQQLLTEHIDLWTSAIENKSSAGRGNSRKKSLYGIKKLRELILELAVRGKLVEQDPDDEPAEVLLKRIVAERDQLIKDKKIKKQKTLPPISDEEKPFELPKGWKWVRLQGLTTLLGDGLHGTPNYDDKGEYYFVNGNNLKDGMIVIKPETKRVNEAEYQKYKKHLNSRTVLVSINGTLGNIAFYAGEAIMLGKSACYFNLATELSKTFIKKLIMAPYFSDYARANATGSTIKNLGLKAINHLPMPLPPLDEQHRIVAKVDELMALCDQLEQQTEQQLDAHQLLVDTLLGTLTQSQNANELADSWTRLSQHFDTLFTTEASIDQLKQTILQLAVMGKLVPQNPNDEPASELLKKVATDRAKLIKEGKIKKQKPLTEINDEEVGFNPPNGWAWSRMGDLVQYQKGYAFKSKDYLECGLMITKIQNLTENHIQNSVYIAPDSALVFAQYLLHEGDIVMTTVGSWFSAPISAVGRSFLINKLFDNSLLNQNAVRIRPWKELAPVYLFACINSPIFKSYLVHEAQGTANQASITQESIKTFLLCVPPKEEQHRIVVKINELFTLCDQLKERLQHNQQTQLLLTDTLVNEALN